MITTQKKIPLIYHSMTLDKASDVFKNDRLLAGWDNVVPGVGKLKGSCLTRNSRLPGGMPGNPGVVRIALDRDVLRYHNKIIPLDAEIVFSATFQSGYYKPSRIVQMNTPAEYAWQEEFIIGKVNQLHRSVVGIQIYTCDNNSIRDSYLIDAQEIAKDYSDRFNIPLSITLDAREQIDEARKRWREEEEEESDDPEEQSGIDEEHEVKKMFGMR